MRHYIRSRGTGKCVKSLKTLCGQGPVFAESPCGCGPRTSSDCGAAVFRLRFRQDFAETPLFNANHMLPRSHYGITLCEEGPLTYFTVPYFCAEMPHTTGICGHIEDIFAFSKHDLLFNHVPLQRSRRSSVLYFGVYSNVRLKIVQTKKGRIAPDGVLEPFELKRAFQICGFPHPVRKSKVQ